MGKHLVKSRSDGTVTKYFGAFRRWKEFISSQGGEALPAEPIHVALYLTKLLDSGSSHNTVQAALYGIKWAHKLRGLFDPTSNYYVTSILESAKRQISVPVVKKDIISSDHVRELCDKYRNSEDLLVLRDLAIIVFCRFLEI
jgi:hypothetical protein